MLLATKTDLERSVQTDEGLNLANKIGGFMELSVLQNPSSVKEVYELLVRRIKDEGSHTIYELNSMGTPNTEKEEEKKGKKEEEDTGPAAPGTQPQKEQSNMNQQKPKIAKVLLIGGYGCGKSNILTQYVENKFV